MEERLDFPEVGLPAYLQHDLDAFKEGVQTKSSFLDCLWGELYGSINGAEIDDQAITHEHAEYLRDKYLRKSFSYLMQNWDKYDKIWSREDYSGKNNS